MNQTVKDINNFQSRYDNALPDMKHTLLSQHYNNLTEMLLAHSKCESSETIDYDLGISESELMGHLEQLEILISTYPCMNSQDLILKLDMFKKVHLNDVPQEEMSQSDIMLLALLNDSRLVFAARA